MKITFLILFIATFSFAQVNRNDTIRVKNLPTDSISTKSEKEVDVISDIENVNAPFSKPKFSPTKAGLYSAVLPGLGQYYNKKYWKIPIVLGAIGTGVGFTIFFDNRYRQYRDAFIAELNGVPHEFSNIPGITKEALGNFQDQQKRYRDYSIAITSLVYILNIVDAVVDAHLYEGRNDPDLVIMPTVIQNQYGFQPAKAGFVLNYKF
ncbi:DUF5683 domain-containing protein [Frigoriflavimonas asaccharolytica]|uniref:DUF5683 domain-containing protein n=1 Tax=Frigoriflavimonas asaccharolytica TaxID=2735899 RepID=A0A8J8GA56_9FLAO|nr:DUF5683 domain-containing protein [Frigoriflavimonas asaccharolytica]NRS93893.1 hypothetical protein [Frigoriflavimonas asaccharolytica]